MLLYEFFRAVVCTVVSSAALGYCYSWPNFNRRRQDVLECTWKSKYSRYRQFVPDLPAKSSLLDSSIARHWGHRTKWIARWGNKIAFWGKQLKTIARWGKHYFKQITYYGDKHWSTHCGRARWGAQINANDNPLWSVEYKEFHQGRVNCDEYENERSYLFPSLAITSFLHFSYWGIIFTQCATKYPGINCYYKHQSSSLLLLLLF